MLEFAAVRWPTGDVSSQAISGRIKIGRNVNLRPVFFSDEGAEREDPVDHFRTVAMYRSDGPADLFV